MFEKNVIFVVSSFRVGTAERNEREYRCKSEAVLAAVSPPKSPSLSWPLVCEPGRRDGWDEPEDLLDKTG